MNTFAAPIFNALTYFGMIVITCIVTFLTSRTLSQGDKKRFVQVLLGMMCLMALTASIAVLGIFAKVDAAPPLFQVFTATVITLFFALGMSRFGNDVATGALAIVLGIALRKKAVPR
jgi:threonine/homoserine/homoserine lactone efflux protein